MTEHYEARKRANERYLAKLAEVRIRMSPEKKEQIKTYAKTSGKSVNQLILDALEAYME